MTPSDPPATLQAIKDRAGVVAKLGPPRPGGDLINAAHRSAADVPVLVAALERVLELTREFVATADRQDQNAAASDDLGGMIIPAAQRARAQTHRDCARALREAITREITGKGE